MADFGAVQPRQFIMDSSRQNGATLGEFHQNNNRYLCTLELFDHSVPVSIPAGAEISIKCKKAGTNQVYVLDKNSPDFAAKVSFTPRENKITVDRWGAMISQDGNILLGVDIDGMSTYTVNYTVDKDLMNGTQVLHHETPVSNFAKTDLSNVSKEDMLRAGKAAGFAQNGLEDVDLTKLSEKVMDGDVGKSLKAVQSGLSTLRDPGFFDRELKYNAAFIALQNRHPVTAGLTAEEIKKLFFSARYEETAPVDLTQPPFDAPTTLMLVCQITSEGQVFKQVLPPHDTNQIVMVEMLFSKGITSATLEIDVVDGEHLEGDIANSKVVFTEQGYLGMFLPLRNDQGYEFVSHHSTSPFPLSISDDRGNVVVGANNIKVETPFFIEHNADSGETFIRMDDVAVDDGIQVTDGIVGADFKATKLQSLDKSVRIAQFSSGVADLSVEIPNLKEGVFAKLGMPEDVNTNFHDQRPWFSDRWAYMGMYLGDDMKDKAYTVQEGDQLDPNVTGGTPVRLGMYFEPQSGYAIATQDGYVELKVVDVMTGAYLIDENGFPVAVRRDYKSGDTLKPELLIAAFKAKGSRKIAFEVDCSFGNQIIRMSPSTAIYIQVVGKDATSGIAEMMFQQHTGYIIESASRYYGVNWMNLAAALTRTKAEQILPAGAAERMGDGLFISAVSQVKAKIENNVLTITDDGTNLPVFCVGQIADQVDSYELLLKNLMTRVKIQDKQNAFIYALMKWTQDAPATLPILTGYQNTVPQFAAGWEKVSEKFISEDVVSGIHEDSNAFTVPGDARQFAIIIYPQVSQIPTMLTLADFEADISPAFTRPMVSSTFPDKERHLHSNLYAYRGLTATPAGIAVLRYTVNDADTELPFGLVSGGGNEVINDRGWNSSGNTWAFEGDGKFLDDGSVTMSYTAQVYCGESVPAQGTSQCSLWLAKVNGDGTFSEVPNSRTEFTCQKSFTGAKTVQSVKFTFRVKAGEAYRMFARSDIADGCYLQSGTNGVPLLRLDIEYKELEEIDQRIIDMIQKNK